MTLKNRFATAAFLTILFLSPQIAPAQAQRPDFNRKQTYDIQHYDIRIGFDPTKKKVIGDTTVRLKPLANGFSSVELDAERLSFESVTLEPAARPLQYRSGASKVVVTLDRAYSPDETVAIRFKYTAIPKKGVYFVPELIEGGKRVRPAQIYTHGEPDEAHHWFPSFDFPSDKATTEQFITAQKGETVIGNGGLVEKTENKDSTVTWHFKMPIPHSTYLVSFVVGEYVNVPDKYKEIPLGMYVYPGREAIVPHAYGRTKDILRAFEEVTKLEYPFNKYDQTVVSGFTFGGMENITATTMSDSEIFLANHAFAKSSIEDLVSHEIAHSWFGNLVTCRNWAELWLNEGFATFMEAVAGEKLYGRDSYIRKIASDAEMYLADDAIHPKKIGLYNRTAGNLNTLFDRPAVTYNKGGAVLHMLRETVGDEAFWKGVSLYLTRHKFANVETADLRNAMEEASGHDLKWFFDQWVYGTGAPKLDVKHLYDPAAKSLRLTVTQTQSPQKDISAAFRLSFDVGIQTDKGTTKQPIVVTARTQEFQLKVDGTPIKVTIDPDIKVPIKTVKSNGIQTELIQAASRSR